MKSYFISLTYLSVLFKLHYLQEESTIKIEDEKNCRERNRLVATVKGDLYRLVDATLGQKLVLQCHYCNENDDGQPKIWYKINKLVNSTPHEVTLGMESNLTANRIHVNSEHSLIIHNFTFDDSGLYYCMGLEGQERENKYNFFIDVVFEITDTSFEIGNLSTWRKYQKDYFFPVNKRFQESRGVEFVSIREKLQLSMELMTDWNPWGICEVCGRPQGHGRRRKKGFCRIKINPIDTRSNTRAVNYTGLTQDELFILNSYSVSCRSVIFSNVYPEISNLTRIIPHFVQEEPCQGTCNPDAEGLGRGWKTGKSKDYKYKKTVVLAENAHLTLVCPESTLQNNVVWKKNGKKLPAGDSVPPENPDEEPHITVDTFSTLYLTEVKSSEEGNYTCEVDKIRMQQVRVYVVSKSRLLTQAFVRHMMYLAFVLSLTLSCYCAGLVVTWTKRHTFKTYEEAKKESADKKKELENLI